MQITKRTHHILIERILFSNLKLNYKSIWQGKSVFFNRNNWIKINEVIESKLIIKWFKQLNIQVNDRTYQTAFGTLLYSQSEQFRRSEKSEPEALQENRVTSIFSKCGATFCECTKKNIIVFLDKMPRKLALCRIDLNYLSKKWCS